MSSRLVFVVLALSGLCSCSGDELECSMVCVADGVAETSEECSEGLLREPSCDAPSSVRRPVVGETVEVASKGQTRSSVVLSVSIDSFEVSGPPNDAELGSGVWGGSDLALLGVVQSSSRHSSSCSFVSREVAK